MVAGTVLRHPILDCARTMETALREVADMPAAYLRARDKAELLTNLARVESQLAELKLRVLAASSDVAYEHGARDAGCWLAPEDSPRVTKTRSGSRGEAFCRLLENLDPKRLPDHGGDATTVMVTVTLDALANELGSAMLGDTVISAGEARRLACTAKIVPAVLGGKSEPLDLGRARRLYTPPQRKAMRLRDKRCRAEGCSIPATWCEAHHLKPWSEGGKTDLTDGVLLCSHHHHRAHDSRYDMTKLATGDYRFHRRT